MLILQIEIVPLQTLMLGNQAAMPCTQATVAASWLLLPWRCLDVVLLLAQCHALDCQPCARSKSFVASITAGEMESTASGARR